MAFCEQCGAKLSPGARFCEECGALAEDAPPAFSASVPEQRSVCKFTPSSWQRSWKEFAQHVGENDLGLIITCEAALLKQLKAPSAKLKSMLEGFIVHSSKRGVNYAYCDLEQIGYVRSDPKSIVKFLKEVVDIARPKYLFILGNEEIVDVIAWEDPTADDNEVESDLCYSTLDTESPVNGQKYDFDSAMRVGRLPTHPGEAFGDFEKYFKMVSECSGKIGEIRPYGLSALVWQDESNDEYRAISHGEVDVSPDVVLGDMSGRLPMNANLLFFNLHGSDAAEHWYGQEGGDYPEAFSPQLFGQMKNPYFVAVEACYGAKYLGGLTEGESSVVSAMQNKCMAFLGSSRIAYGTPQPVGCCADVVVGTYIKRLADGDTAGDALAESRKELCRKTDGMDDSEVKTLAEFSLYGDPSVRMNASKKKGIGKLFKGLGGSVPKGLHIPMPDVRNAVEMALAEVDAKIEAVIDDYAAKHLLPSKGVADDMTQRVYRMKRSGRFQKVYSYRAGNLPQVAKVYFDGQGRIHKAIVSK